MNRKITIVFVFVIFIQILISCSYLYRKNTEKFKNIEVISNINTDKTKINIPFTAKPNILIVFATNIEASEINKIVRNKKNILIKEHINKKSNYCGYNT
ncbi:hypothetical protein [Borreliella americana]|uniref:hypothetical protein n=1 Tax=Borreliella americana TaxID=478807 RepID=UPI001E47FBA9|nr:hypothetical protein [Borreliella americana]MCD2332761.1 hypothetical protein [Borreliella americana]